MAVTCPRCGHEITDWFTLTARMPEETRQVWDAAVDALRRDGFDLHTDRRVAAGQVVEALCASYLAGAASPGEPHIFGGVRAE